MSVGVSTNGSRLTSNTVLDTVRDTGNTSNGRAQLLGAANLDMQASRYTT